MITEFGARATVKQVTGKFRRFARMFPAKAQLASEALKEHFNLINLAAQIRGEVEPLIEKNREAYDSLFGKKHESQDFVFGLKKYAEYGMANAHSLGRETEPDLAAENSIGYAMQPKNAVVEEIE